MEETVDKPTTRARPKELNPRQIRFITLICEGKTKATAYRIAYEKPSCSNKYAAQKGNETARRSIVAARLAELGGRALRGQQLSLEDRLEYLSGIAQNPKERTSDRTQAMALYTKIKGDAAPDRHILAGMKDAEPIKTETKVIVEAVTEPSVAEKVAYLMAKLDAPPARPDLSAQLTEAEKAALNATIRPVEQIVPRGTSEQPNVDSQTVNPPMTAQT